MRIRTPSRIHITLIDLNGSLGRVDGGVGIALEKPYFELEFVENDKIEVEGCYSEEIKIIAEKVINELKLDVKARIRVLNHYERHIGLGSTTQLYLAIAKGITLLNNINLNVYELAKIVNRGGTSGIGINAFEHGGFIIDAGHGIRDKPDFLPSDFSRSKPAKMLFRYDFPWDLILVIPKDKKRIYGGKELMIFKEYCPISEDEVERLCRVILMKLIPAVVEEDIEEFGSAINLIQRLGFKRIEISLQNDSVKELLKICQLYSYGAGLSSFGPVIYCIAEKRILLERLREEKDRIEKIILTKPNNSGYKVLY